MKTHFLCRSFPSNTMIHPHRFIFFEAKNPANYDSLQGLPSLKDALTKKEYAPRASELTIEGKSTENPDTPEGRQMLQSQGKFMLLRYQYDHNPENRELLDKLNGAIQKLRKADLGLLEGYEIYSSDIAKELKTALEDVRARYRDKETGKLVTPPLKIPLDPNIPQGRNQLRHVVEKYIKKNPLTVNQKEDKEYLENRDYLQKILSLSFYTETGQLYKISKEERDKKWGAETFESEEGDISQFVIYDTPEENKKLSKEQKERNNRIIGEELKAIFDELTNKNTEKSVKDISAKKIEPEPKTEVPVSQDPLPKDEPENLTIPTPAHTPKPAPGFEPPAPPPPQILKKEVIENDNKAATQNIGSDAGFDANAPELEEKEDPKAQQENTEEIVKNFDELLLDLENYLNEPDAIISVKKWTNKDGEPGQEAYEIQLKDCAVNTGPGPMQLSELFDANFLVSFEKGNYIGNFTKMDSKGNPIEIPLEPHPNIEEFMNKAVEKYYTVNIEKSLEEQQNTKNPPEDEEQIEMSIDETESSDEENQEN